MSWDRWIDKEQYYPWFLNIQKTDKLEETAERNIASVGFKYLKTDKMEELIKDNITAGF